MNHSTDPNSVYKHSTKPEAGMKERIPNCTALHLRHLSNDLTQYTKITQQEGNLNF